MMQQGSSGSGEPRQHSKIQQSADNILNINAAFSLPEIALGFDAVSIV